MKSTILISVFVFFIILELSSANYKWQKEKISDPFLDPPMFCNIKENGHPFCDPESQLDPTQVNYILERQNELTRIVKCPCSQGCKEGQSGLVVGFAIIKDYEDKSNSQVDEANPAILQEFSDHIRERWNLGSCDNSLLITIATDKKQYGVSIGAKASQILNDTWFTGILEENFRERSNTFSVYTKLKDILFMFKEAIAEELKRNSEKSEGVISSLTDSPSNTLWYTVLIISILVVVLIVSLILFVVLRHRKENDDVSIRDWCTRNFWFNHGNQYKKAKQSEGVNEKDLEKNEDEETKAKLASTEDLKNEEIQNVDLEYPGKLSKI